jgi:hypothetical protein
MNLQQRCGVSGWKDVVEKAPPSFSKGMVLLSRGEALGKSLLAVNLVQLQRDLCLESFQAAGRVAILQFLIDEVLNGYFYPVHLEAVLAPFAVVLNLFDINFGGFFINYLIQ